MTKKAVAELDALVKAGGEADWISNLWDRYKNQRVVKEKEWMEVDRYLYATDTSTTANASLPHAHKTTTPKLTQIRDNLHSNYLSSLFPNDKWLQWNAYSKEAAHKNTSKIILSYMENKTREGGFRDVISQLLYDYIDKGNAFAYPIFEKRYNENSPSKTAAFVGPKACRIDPVDIVFNPDASSFENTFKIVRSVTTLGAIRKHLENYPEQEYWKAVIERRDNLYRAAGTHSKDDWNKVSQYQVDGFGSLQEYYGSDVVELLEFYGDYHSQDDGVFQSNRMITIADRSILVRNAPIPTYSGEPAIYHVGWRKRSNNLWAMGPLDNLVGMQYMLDHYTNMMANALDLKVQSPKKVIGDVEPFVWGPNSIIQLDEGGDVQEMAQQFGDVYAVKDFLIDIENRMEMYAGAPREAMGIRTPGEKTAFEVQALENAAGRIFQEKITQFEIFMEQLLNGMLEEAHRNFPVSDMIRIVDNDLGAIKFQEVTQEEITADGILRPVGARHYAQKAQELQNLVGIFSSPMFQFIAPHTSGKGLVEFVNDVADLRGYNIFSPNVAIFEQQETQGLASQAEEDNIMMDSQGFDEMLLDPTVTDEGIEE